jgi:dTMP kinase
MLGCFITFEGGEGAGKSTMIRRANEWFQKQGHDVVQTREPGGTVLAEKIRSIVLDQQNGSLCATAELLLLFAARAQHLDELIRPALARNATVLCDRFTDATWAYQGAGRGMPGEVIASLEQLVHGDLQPQLTLLLDLPVQLGRERMSVRGMADRIEQESMQFFARVRQSYLERAAAEPRRFAVIDAAQDETSVWGQIERVLEQRFGS